MFLKPFISMLLCAVIYFNSTTGVSNACEADETMEDHLIKEVVKQAVEYNGWMNDTSYEQVLGKYYTGKLLETILNSVKDFRESNTDWYSLTFLQNCHIVYNDENSATAFTLLREVDITNNSQILLHAIFTLHKTSSGWRIINVDFPLTPYSNELL